MTTDRILLFVHYNKTDSLDDYVIYQLGQLRPHYSKIILISNSRLSNVDTKRLSGLYDEFIQRRNIGYDFAAWRDGIDSVGWNKIQEYDSLTLMNDTCFGPIQPIGSVFKKMENKGPDFWGITMHNGSKVGMPGTNGPVPRHIQSYFMVFKRKIVKSESFQKFWKDVIDADDVEFVIQHYETQLTGIIGRRFTYDTAVKHCDELPDITYLKPKTLITNGIPFVKTKALIACTDFLTPWSLARYIESSTGAPVSYIYGYINKNPLDHARRSLKKSVYWVREWLKRLR